MPFSAGDEELVAEAVARAELTTEGEVVTAMVDRSDEYGDVAAHWAVVAMLSVLTVLSLMPGIAEWLYLLISADWNGQFAPTGLFTMTMLLLILAFLAVQALLRSMKLRILLTPETIKARRVHRRALELFRVAVESRTRAATGVLLYVSLVERRAEIVVDRAIHARVDEEIWGDIMQALVVAIRDNRAAAGMVEAVGRLGVILTEYFPRTGPASNELQDRPIRT